MEAIYNWNYESEIDELRTLYANALDRQWIAMRELDWSAEIDREAFSTSFSMGGIESGARLAPGGLGWCSKPSGSHARASGGQDASS